MAEADMTVESAEALSIAADALMLLARLHDREIDAEAVHFLRAVDAGGLFCALMEGEDGQQAAQAFAEAIRLLPDPPDTATLDTLAADFADTYLTHGYRISPNGSVWMTEESLERQLPMFEVREWYDHYGITVPDWRKRSDDHIVHELEFVVHLLRLGTRDAALDAGAFLDRHVLPWVPEFGRRVAARATEPLTATTGLLTAFYLDALRELLVQATGTPRGPVELRPDQKPKKEAEPLEDSAFIPGVSESW